MSAPELTLSWAQSVSDVTLPMARSLREQPRGAEPRTPAWELGLVQRKQITWWKIPCPWSIGCCLYLPDTSTGLFDIPPGRVIRETPALTWLCPTRIPDTRPLPNNRAQLANRGAILTLSHRHLLLRFSLQMKWFEEHKVREEENQEARVLLAWSLPTTGCAAGQAVSHWLTVRWESWTRSLLQPTESGECTFQWPWIFNWVLMRVVFQVNPWIEFSKKSEIRDSWKERYFSKSFKL